MTMLFSQMVRLACDDVTISGMKVGQLCGLLRRKEEGEGAGESVRGGSGRVSKGPPPTTTTSRNERRRGRATPA